LPTISAVIASNWCRYSGVCRSKSYLTAEQVGVDHVGPGLQRRIPLHRGDPGLGHHDVQPAQLADALLQRRRQLRPLPHVGLHRHDPPVLRLDQPDRLLQVIGRRKRVLERRDVMREVDRDDVGAFLRQPHRVTAALTACRPRDEGDLALYTTHARASLRPVADRLGG
jgi:hypothetical protein